MKGLDEYTKFRRLAAEQLQRGDRPWRVCLTEMELYMKACRELAAAVSDSFFTERSIDELETIREGLFGAAAPREYEDGWLYPPYAKRQLGEETGGLLSMVYADLLTAGGFYALQGNQARLDALAGLCDTCRQACINEMEAGHAGCLQKALESRYLVLTDIFAGDSVRSMVSADEDSVISRILAPETDLSDLRYLYRYGYPVGDNEKTLAGFLNGLPAQQIETLATVFVGGYIKGFAVTGKDISIKKTVKIEYPVGFERVIRRVVELFAEEGLTATFVPEPVLSLTGRDGDKRGVYATAFNRCFDYDHKDDKGWYLSEAFNRRRLTVMEACFEELRTEAGEHGGPAVIEVFGEKECKPDPQSRNYTYTEEQTRLNLAFMMKSQELTTGFIPGEERSFTVIAFPVPEIGEAFEEIFRKIVEINTLDYALYRDIQQRLIDALDAGVAVEVKGANGNDTDMHVVLHELSDPGTQTNFENCVADVNIPVGEVFTSPVLEGTNGTLFVSHVYLGGYEYHDLRLEFQDGMVTKYQCSDFAEEEECRRLIEDNILHHHATLPIGEFAIGTNTLAYRLARDYGIMDKLPILIMEKTGPHFAVGDTCYSYAEDIPMRNPDGRECIARDNSISVLRRSADEEERHRAYFHCHTDITIPFDELGRITVLGKDGRKTDIIRDGRFVLEGTEALNTPLC